jgi:hypothetical protein
MEALKDILNKLPKQTLVLLVIFFGGMYAHHKIKDNEMSQKSIKEGVDLTLKTQNIILKNQTEMITDIQELKQKQNVVITTLPPISKKACNQIQQIYDQMRLDQNTRDRYKMDNKDGSKFTPSSFIMDSAMSFVPNYILMTAR